MPKRGVHPVIRGVTYVLKNGASIELPSVVQRSEPYILQIVRIVRLSVLPSLALHKLIKAVC